MSHWGGVLEKVRLKGGINTLSTVYYYFYVLFRLKGVQFGYKVCTVTVKIMRSFGVEKLPKYRIQ